jgi:hypothetical protein
MILRQEVLIGNIFQLSDNEMNKISLFLFSSNVAEKIKTAKSDANKMFDKSTLLLK